jgi:class 3 adenylate cyclase
MGDHQNPSAAHLDTASDVCYAPSDGGRIAYRVLGAGPADLIVSPGFGSHVDLISRDPYFHRFAHQLTGFARVALFDKRGSGLSDPISRLPTYEERSRDWGAVMDDLGIDKGWLFGHSESGPSAILFAATHPERVHGLILGSAFASFSLEHRQRLVDEGYLDQRALDHSEAIHADILRRVPSEWGTGRVILAIVPEYGSTLLRPAVAVSERLLGDHVRITQELEAWRAGDVSAILTTLDVPTLVLHRSEDYIPIGHGRFLADQIPGAEFVEAPGTGHNMWSGGESTFIAEQIERFITGAAPGRRRANTTLVSMLFTDIVNSTEHALSLGDEWSAVLQEHHDLVGRCVEGFGGRTVKSLGDGVLAAFPGPVAAVECAAAINTGSTQIGLTVRAGVHTGDAELLPDGDLAGLAVHLAARVMAAAEGGQILVSRPVKDLAAGSILQFRSVGPHRLKGFDGDHELFESTLGAARPPTRSQMEINVLHRALLSGITRFPRSARAIVTAVQRRTAGRRRNGS